MPHVRTGLLPAALLIILFALPAVAIEVALPGDFMYYEVIDNDPGNEGYYYCSTIMTTQYPGSKPYTFIMNARGEVVWYKTSTMFSPLGNFKPTHGQHMMHAHGDSNHPRAAVLLAPDSTPLDTIPRVNPFRPTMTLDAHDYHLDEDGNLWSLWWDPVNVDMTPYGGNPNALVDHHCIQQWDPDGNLLYEWRSVDHTSTLPYNGRIEQDSILNPYFEHLHVNSFHLLPDGDIVVSARTMDIGLRIDRDTGEALWRIGYGPLNDFEFFTNLPDYEHLVFNLQHDITLLPDGRMTVFDNGNRHQPPRAYGREYQLDFDNMTAELLWEYRHEDGFFSPITGSTRIVDGNKRLICWGGGTGELSPTVSATEVTADNELVWELTAWASPDGPNAHIPAMFRVYKRDSFVPSAKPYISSAWYESEQRFEIQCNWFGHEDEVDGYRLFISDDPGALADSGITWDGFFTLEGAAPSESYYARMHPVDGNGDPTGPPSEIIKLFAYRSGLSLIPLQNQVHQEGGEIVYDIYIKSMLQDPVEDLIFRTRLVDPDGEVGDPLVEIPFDMPPGRTRAFYNQAQPIPAATPAGEYQLRGEVVDPDDTVLFTEQFTWIKDTTSSVDESPRQLGEDHPATSPGDFELSDVSPNPFNAGTAVSITLRRAGDLRVTVYNSVGRLVATLHDGPARPGEQRLHFDGRGLASGIYLLQGSLDGRESQTRKLLLLQ